MLFAALVRQSKGGELARGLFWAHLILFLHILLIAFLGLVVLVLGGLARHLIWFMVGGAVLVLISAYWVYRRFKKNRDKIFQSLNTLPQLKDREFEIRILGGLVTFTANRRGDAGAYLPNECVRPVPRLEDPNPGHSRELLELADLLEQNLITTKEFERAKKHILGSE